MIDPTPADDELVSSYIDGEATLDEVTRVETEPDLSARVQEFQAAKDLLLAPVAPLSDSDVERLIDNAFAQSASSNRITDLAAARNRRSFRITGLNSPQRLASIAATLLLLAGVVGALIALNSDSGNEMLASTSVDSAEMADDSFAEDGDAMAFDADLAEAAGETAPLDMNLRDDLADSAEAMPEAMSEAMSEFDEATPEFDEAEVSDMAAEDNTAGDDLADSVDYEQDAADATDGTNQDGTNQDGTNQDGAARNMQYRPLDLEIAERYETLDSLVDHATEQWRELVAAKATAVPQAAAEQGIAEQGIAEQALTEAACGQELRTFIETLGHNAGNGGVSVGETAIADSLTTVVLIELSSGTAELLAAAEPDCEIVQLAMLNP